MPVLDGWETTKTLVEMMRSKSVPEIPIIGLTAFNSTEDINRCLDAGMREVLTKPLNLNELKQVLLKLFN
jgi:CheY-like chemotaxis protein